MKTKRIFFVGVFVLLIAIIFVNALSIDDIKNNLEFSNLKTNSEGGIESGEIIFGEEESTIGNLIGNLPEEDIIVKNVEFVKKGGITNLIFLENASVTIKGEIYNGIDASKLSNIKLDEEGNILEAVLTAAEDTAFTFDDENYGISAGQTILYKEGKVTIIGKEGEAFNFKSKGEEEFLKINLFGESVNIEKDLEGNKIISGNFKIGENTVYGLEEGIGKISISPEGKITRVWKGSDVTIENIKYKTSGGDLNIYYDENFNPLEHVGENYFNYDKNIIYLGGSGFTTELKEGNEIFPEFFQNELEGLKTEGRLEFTLKEGSLEIEKISEDGRPLALLVNANGGFDIKNGHWVLESNGEKIFSKMEEDWLSSDMRIEYSVEGLENKIYDLSTDSYYDRKFSKKEIEKISQEIKRLNDETDKRQKEINSLLEIPGAKKISLELEEILDKDSKLYDERYLLTDSLSECKDCDKINSNILIIDKKLEELFELETKKLSEKDNFVYIDEEGNEIFPFGEIDLIQRKMGDLQEELQQYQNKLDSKSEITKTLFRETLLFGDGNVKVSFDEYAQGSPFLKNVPIEGYDKEVFNLNLDQPAFCSHILSSAQTCAPTQVYFKGLYDLEELNKGNIDEIEFTISNGERLRYNKDGTYTLWSEREKKVVEKYNQNQEKGFENWMKNVFAYINTGALRANLVHIENAKDIMPGDILTTIRNEKTGYGHSKGIKEKVKVFHPEGDQTCYWVFAGTDPAIYPRFYDELECEEDLQESINAGKLVVLRWPN